MNKLRGAILFAKLAYHIIEKRQVGWNRPSLPKKNSKSYRPSVCVLYQMIWQRECHTWMPQKPLIEDQLVLQQVESMQVQDLEALKEDWPNWTKAERYNLTEAIRKAKKSHKIIPYAKVFYADQWALTSPSAAFYRIYLPIFLFSIRELRRVDDSYTSSVLLEIQALSAAEVQLLKLEVLHWTQQQRVELRLIIGPTTAFDHLYRQLFLQQYANQKWLPNSFNIKILVVYEIAISNEYSAQEHGFFSEKDKEILLSLNTEDWEALKADLPDWPTNHLETLTYGIMYEPLSHNMAVHLLLALVKIGKSRGYSNEIICAVIDDLPSLLRDLADLLDGEEALRPYIQELLEVLDVEHSF